MSKELAHIAGKWFGTHFESSSVLTEQFADFLKDMRSYLKKNLSKKFTLDFHRGHFEFYAFIQNIETKKWVYISISDVRFFQDRWYNEMLIRTAKFDKDYTGGTNNHVALSQLFEKVEDMTK